MKIEVVAHDLPELTPEQLKAQEEPRRPSAWPSRHGKPHGHKRRRPPSRAAATAVIAHAEAGDPNAPEKRNGSRPHWHRGKDKARGNAA